MNNTEISFFGNVYSNPNTFVLDYYEQQDCEMLSYYYLIWYSRRYLSFNYQSLAVRVSVVVYAYPVYCVYSFILSSQLFL